MLKYPSLAPEVKCDIVCNGHIEKSSIYQFQLLSLSRILFDQNVIWYLRRIQYQQKPMRKNT